MVLAEVNAKRRKLQACVRTLAAVRAGGGAVACSVVELEEVDLLEGDGLGDGGVVVVEVAGGQGVAEDAVKFGLGGVAVAGVEEHFGVGRVERERQEAQSGVIG